VREGPLLRRCVSAQEGLVSALVASPARQDKVQVLQRTLYRAAKADPGRRFHALYDKVHRRDVLERAWLLVRINRGAPGIDWTTIADVEEYGVARLLDELAVDLKEQRWRPLPARRVWIPKPGSSEQRPLSIPAVRDRIVQAALKIVIEPIFEADFLPCSFGFRPKRSAHDALQVLIEEAWRGRRWVVETDIASCFEAIPHDRLMEAVEERVCDRKVLKLLRAMVRAGVMDDGVVRGSVTGTPQGGVISPLLCNVYLHRLDRQWQTRRYGRLVRYADDVVVMCVTRQQAEDALGAITAVLGELGWRPRRRRPGSCTWRREARGSTSSASVTDG
jgi:RNA-directed DNA polymerase